MGPGKAQSPMFTHAIESFEHALEHYVDGTTRGSKFAILHVDHAIEPCLKEKAVSLGKSIYKSDGQTLSMHEKFNSLTTYGTQFSTRGLYQTKLRRDSPSRWPTAS